MYDYTAYGQTIQSTVELPELPTVDDASTPDVVVRREGLAPVPESVDGTGGRRIDASPDRCRLSYDSIGTFLVEDGDRILFDPASPAVVEQKVLRRLVENEMLGLILHQRGLLVLHASAVSVDGDAAVFLGPRGAGKSTTAAAFHTQGHTVLEDDVVGIRFDRDRPTVVPGVPQLRLLPDAAEALGVEDTVTYDDDGGSEKGYRQLRSVPEEAPLAACYVLQEGDRLSVDALPEREQLFELIARTYARGLLADTETTPDHFEQCSTVVETAPFLRLRRPNDHGRLPDLVERVADDLRSRD